LVLLVVLRFVEVVGVCGLIVALLALDVGLAIGSDIVLDGLLDLVPLFGDVGMVVVGPVGDVGDEPVDPGVPGDPPGAGAGAVWARAAPERARVAMPARVAIRINPVLIR
jgi:hypothetical protein